ncbi:MAG: MBL fold metallo-hydrolase [Candidatus Eiseniibacteriota bacterium]
MVFEQFYLACLSHASYLIGDGGEAAVVDPQRDVDLYLDAARERGLTIRYVIESHLHADFVSGHRELAERAGAEIVLGHRAEATFPHRAVKEGDVIRLGSLRLVFLETPGHTPESMAIVVYDDSAGAMPLKVLTGDTLFVGDVGRPDLVTSKGYTAEDMAGMLYDSVHTKLLTLPDSVEVYPSHGAGSACGRNIGRERFSTIGEQRRVNPSLRAMSRAEFIRRTTTDLPPAPAYFGFDAETNRRGAPALADLPAPPGLAPGEVRRRAAEGAIVLDVRDGARWANGHVPGSLNVGLGGQFASWAGSLVPVGAPIVLVTDELGEVEEARMRLARVGLENVVGYLEGGIAEWDRAGEAVGTTELLSVDELRAQLATTGDALRVLDVRRPDEFEMGHVPGATNEPLDRFAPRALETARAASASASASPSPSPGAGPLAVVCQTGYRSSTAVSLLAPHHRGPIYNVVGGTTAWVDSGAPLERVETPA